jgi:hypothetical protein
MAAWFLSVDLLDPEAVELIRGSLPEMEAAPSRGGPDGGVGYFCGGRDGDETTPIWGEVEWRRER